VSPAGQREAVRVGQAHVEQHDLGAQRARGGSNRRPVRRFPDNCEALRFEQPPRNAPKGLIVVNNEHGPHGGVGYTLLKKFRP